MTYQAPGRRVAVVSEAFARRFFEDADPIGQHLGIGDEKHGQDFAVVGVAEDVKYTAAGGPNLEFAIREAITEVLALALACLGLYGVTTYAVAQRTREIGVRMALGADRAGIMRAIVGAPIAKTLAGLAVGIPLALLAGSAISAQLFGLGGQDPVVLGAAILLLLATTAVAAVIPAMRAASVDPVKALRMQ